MPMFCSKVVPEDPCYTKGRDTRTFWKWACSGRACHKPIFVVRRDGPGYSNLGHLFLPMGGLGQGGAQRRNGRLGGAIRRQHSSLQTRAELL